jgi:hypothetical protein
MTSGAGTSHPGIVSPGAYIFSSSLRDEFEETALERNDSTMGKKLGSSFCWRRAFGASTAKRNMSKAIGAY